MVKSVPMKVWMAMLTMALAAAMSLPAAAFAQEGQEVPEAEATTQAAAAQPDAATDEMADTGAASMETAAPAEDVADNAVEEAGDEPEPATPSDDPQPATEPAQQAEEPAESQSPEASEPAVEPVAEPAETPATPDAPAAVETPSEEPAAAQPATDADVPAADDATAKDSDPKATAPAKAVATVAAPAQKTQAQKAAASTPVKAASKATATPAKKTAKAAAKKVAPVKKVAAKTGKLFKNGWYFLESAKKLALVLTGNGKNKTATVNKDADKKVQKWYLKYVPSAKAYYITNAKTKKYLSVSASTAKNGAGVVEWSKGKGAKAAKLWVVSEDANGGYVLKSKLGKVVLDINRGGTVKGGSKADVAKAKFYKKGLTANQRWYLLPVKPSVAKSNVSLGGGVYQIKLLDSTTSQALMVAGSSKKDSAKVNSKASGTSMAQKWGIAGDGKGYYTIINLNSGKALTVKGGLHAATTNIIQKEYSKKDNAQKWSLRKNDDGSISLISKATGMALDLASDNNGAKARTYFDNGAARQKFEVSATPITVGKKSIFSVALKKDDTMTLGMKDRSTANGGKLESSTYRKRMDQKFELEHVSGNIYTIKSIISGKNVMMKGTSVYQTKPADAQAQQWKAVWKGTGLSFVNVKTGKALAAKNVKIEGTKVLGAKANGSANQLFVLQKRNLIDNGYYYLQLGSPKWNSNVLESDGSASKVSSPHNSKAKKYKITYKGNETYTIENAKTGNPVAGSLNWKASLNPNGGLNLVSKWAGKALTAKNSTGSAANMEELDISSAQQRWYADPTTDLKSYQEVALEKVRKRGSPTNYYFVVNVKSHRMMMFHRANKNADWEMLDDWLVTTGIIDRGTGTRTILKDGYIKRHQMWLHGEDKTWSAKYCTFWGGNWFHSVLHRFHSEKIWQPWLGRNISNGCVRMSDYYCSWIYYNFNTFHYSNVTTWWK